jgi:hypothetical protein
MKVFLVLNGMALVFMIYVLVNFWKEGVRASGGSLRKFKIESVYASRPQVFVVTRPLEADARRAAKSSVVPFPAPKVGSEGQTGGTPGGRPRQKKYSTG